MKILALNPPFLPRFSRESRSPAVAKSGTLYYPMWLAYAVGYLEKMGHEVLFIDACASNVSIEDVCKKASEFKADMAVIDTSTPSIDSDIETSKKLKEAIPNLFTVLVGVHVSALPKETLSRVSDGLDAVVAGEYDAVLVDLAEKLSQKDGKSKLKEVDGLAFRDENGEIIVNKPREYMDNLDDIPFVSSVYKKHLDINPYFYGHSRHPIIVIVTGRGCPFHCVYCVVPQTLMGHKYRKRSIKSIVDEFRYIAENFPEVKEIMIEDDTLTADRERCREFSRELIKQNLTHIPWSANSRADVDYETMALMKKAGCRLFCVGFESGEQKILDNIKKATNIDKIQTFMKDAKRAGVLIHGCFMVGNPGETSETLQKTLDFSKKLSPDTAQFYPIMVYPGTEAYDYFENKGWITTHEYRKWITDDGLHSSVVSNPDLKYEELVTFCDRSRREFYLRPAYILSKILQVFTHPKEAKRLFMGGASLLKYIFTPSLKSKSESK